MSFMAFTTPAWVRPNRVGGWVMGRQVVGRGSWVVGGGSWVVGRGSCLFEDKKKKKKIY